MSAAKASRHVAAQPQVLVRAPRQPRGRPQQARRAVASDTIHSDYIVLGAGVIGLSCARELLRSDPDASVTVLEQAEPAQHSSNATGTPNQLQLQGTSTATGAGQGYVLLCVRAGR